jgi:DNA polymerase III epsilon subunit-like protein
MSLLKQYIQLQIKDVISEGQIEKAKLPLPEVINKLKNRVLIFFDTETTGFSPKINYTMITEIAAVAYDTSTGERLGQYNMKAHLSSDVKSRIEREKQRKETRRGKYKQDNLTPWDPKRKTIEDILGMTGYHSEKDEYKYEYDMMKEFSDFINQFSSKNPILVAHNARFDMYQIGKALERHGLPKLSRFSVLDTMVLTKNYLFPLIDKLQKSNDPEAIKLTQSLKSGKSFQNRLKHLGDAFEVSTKHWHSALADTEQLAGILAAIISFFERKI